MPVFEITSPDGRKFRVTGPDGSTKEQALERVQAQVAASPRNESPATPTAADSAFPTNRHNFAMGAIKGASDIGATLLRPVDALLNFTGATQLTNKERRASLDQFFAQNAEPDSWAFKGGELAADMAGTAGIGGLAAKGVRAAGNVIPALAPYAPKLAAALETGGFSTGGTKPTTFAAKAGDLATRVGAGGIVGGASAGAVNPDDANAGAVLGGLLPAGVKLGGALGSAILPKASAEVVALAQKAKNLGIDIPADRLANSKPLNAVAASLNYVPFSGRAGTEERMISQLDRAVSRTFGQDSDNVTAALRKAGADLGKKFDDTLQANLVKADGELFADMDRNLATAKSELTKKESKIIANKVKEIKAAIGEDGAIDGQTAYNIKKALDRIGSRNSNEAYYARELKKTLMAALNRSLGPDEAAAFTKVRQQYGNMLDLENLAQNGAEGGISVGRLANLKNINNQELQDIADIAAQFVRTRESPHGAAQRVTLGALVGGVTGAAGMAGMLPQLGAGLVAGRALNTALNSNAAKNAVLGQGGQNRLLDYMQNPVIRNALYRLPNQSSP